MFHYSLFNRAQYWEPNAFSPIQRATCTNRENTFPDSIGLGSTLNMSARVLENSLPLFDIQSRIVFVGFSTWPHELPSLNVHSISISVPFYLFSFYLFLSFAHTYSHICTAFWRSVYPLGWSKVYCSCGLKSPCENSVRSPLPNPPRNWT